MTIKEAAHSLNETLNYPKWLSCIGVGKTDIGEDCIHMYIKPDSAKGLFDSLYWEGYPVKITTGVTFSIGMQEQ